MKTYRHYTCVAYKHCHWFAIRTNNEENIEQLVDQRIMQAVTTHLTNVGD